MVDHLSFALMRTEKDTLGEKSIPDDAYYGVQTARAIENFPVSGIREHRQFIRAYLLIKKAAALANQELGLLDAKIAAAIVSAADEALSGRFDAHFVVDVFQAGAGTSFNMNVNEVLANRAIELLGGRKGDYSLVHPNDHVNKAQSTNDSFPTAMRLGSLFLIEELVPVLTDLRDSLAAKAKQFDDILKSGRTHLQDAVPVRLGQEFGSYACAIEKCTALIRRASESLKELGIGGTAAGTGINTHPEYRFQVVRHLSELTQLDVKPAENLFYAMNSMVPFTELSGGLKILALELIRIANDLRLLSSGPTTGFAEIILPPVQPGSSIMPGKVNPVMPEALNMVAFQVVGHDVTVSMAAQAGQMELNVMMPVIIYNLMQSMEILKNMIRVFKERCVDGITADVERCRYYAEHSLGLATALNPYIGYERAAKLAVESFKTGRSIKELVLEKGYLQKGELEEILAPQNMTEPRAPKRK